LRKLDLTDGLVNYLKNNPSIFGAAHIPINLYKFVNYGRKFVEKTIRKNLTIAELYQRIWAWHTSSEQPYSRKYRLPYIPNDILKHPISLVVSKSYIVHIKEFHKAMVVQS